MNQLRKGEVENNIQTRKIEMVSTTAGHHSNAQDTKRTLYTINPVTRRYVIDEKYIYHPFFENNSTGGFQNRKRGQGNIVIMVGKIIKSRMIVKKGGF